MPVAAEPRPEVVARTRAWQSTVQDLVTQLAGWAQEVGWTVERSVTVAHDPPAGDYEVPVLTIRMPDGELTVQPVSMLVYGGAGRVDLEGLPTLSRVKLIPSGDGWTIMTDSNVPLRVPWTRDSFVQLANDLVS